MSYIPKSSNVIPCRHCGKQVREDDKSCLNCGGKAPGIYSQCPNCGSSKYVYHYYGFVIQRAIAGFVLLGPLGLLGGSIGSGVVECICLECRRGVTVK